MPFYRNMNTTQPDGKRTTERLLSLREALKTIPERTLNETLLLATWNIRDFDKPQFGQRLEEAIYYIAEIIARFDLVAIQEVNKDLTGLDRVMKILGPNWKRVFSDETLGDPGNEERLAFVYDSRKVKFGGLAGELILPQIKDEEGNEHPVSQISRSPLIVGFTAGWCRFMLTTVHIVWGGDEANPPQRVREIREIAKLLKQRTEDETAWARNLILLGDFNIFGNDDETFQQIVDAGFEVPDALLDFRSNVKHNRHYDQIAFRTRSGSLESTGKAGVFNYYETVFKNTIEDRDIYAPFMRDIIIESNQRKTLSKKSKEYDARSEVGKTNYYSTYWRTHQMSDHFPMWVELRIDYSDEYLQYKLNQGIS